VTAPPAPGPDLPLVGDALEHWARTTPDAEAMVFGDRRWTWAQWRDRVRRATGVLRGRGVRRGDVVAFVDRNHVACLEISLGGAAAGAATAVLSWRLSTDELAYVLDDCGAQVVFVGAELMPAVAEALKLLTGARDVVVVGYGSDEPDEYEALLADAAPLAPLPEVQPSDPVLVLYTSGTTGFPKGAMLTHRNLVAQARAAAEVFGYVPGDRGLIALPLFHVAGSAFSLRTIHAGTPTILSRDATPPSLFPALACGATHAFLVPALIAGLLEAGEGAVTALSGLTWIGYGASPMPLPTLRAAMSAWPAARFVQIYGMTELAGGALALDDPAHRDPVHPERLASAGRPVSGMELRVVDPVTGADVEPGGPGELWWRGAQVMAGYLGRPEATAETITADGWLRSGDVGFVDDGGFVFICDRIKDMVITGGENVYCPEVERVLAEHPAVAEVAVIGVPDERWGECVKAVVVPVPGGDVVEADLIAYCRDRLAHFKCPGSVDAVDALPRNATGKVLKRDLLAPYWAGRDREV
jgi:acyl-CoA synthetase (AMP-forming)/AMP-acid ligase II